MHVSNNIKKHILDHHLMIRSRDQDKIVDRRDKIDMIKRSRDLHIYKIRSSKVQVFKVKVKVKRVL